MEHIKVHFVQDGTTVLAAPGDLLVDVIRASGHFVETPCGGAGICNKCLVTITTALHKRPAHVHSCTYRIAEETTVDLSAHSGDLYVDPIEHTSAYGPSSLGLAIDLGTTGVACDLVLLGDEDRKVVARASFTNPQTAYGADVLSRISFCMDSQGNTEILRDQLLDVLDVAITKMLGATSRDVIATVVVAGNTAMQHIVWGVCPASLATAPYKPVFEDLRSGEAPGRLHLKPGTPMVTFPNISGFVGGDVVAGLLATDLGSEKQTRLLLDMGTNGEIVLSHAGSLYATSAAAGPAFEGANISCGMRAVPGAIDHVYSDGPTSLGFTTFGRKKAAGICGSGLIDLIAVLLDQGHLSKDGTLQPGQDGMFWVTEEVFLTQRDVRQFQLAKGAIRAGIEIVLDKAGCSWLQIEEVVVAGAFGKHLDKESLLRVGMLDSHFAGAVTFAGNTSLRGAKKMMTDQQAVSEVHALANQVTSIDLATAPSFQTLFLDSLSF